MLCLNCNGVHEPPAGANCRVVLLRRAYAEIDRLEAEVKQFQVRQSEMLEMIKMLSHALLDAPMVSEATIDEFLQKVGTMINQAEGEASCRTG